MYFYLVHQHLTANTESETLNRKHGIGVSGYVFPITCFRFRVRKKQNTDTRNRKDVNGNTEPETRNRKDVNGNTELETRKRKP